MILKQELNNLLFSFILHLKEHQPPFVHTVHKKSSHEFSDKVSLKRYNTTITLLMSVHTKNHLYTFLRVMQFKYSCS